MKKYLTFFAACLAAVAMLWQPSSASAQHHRGGRHGHGGHGHFSHGHSGHGHFSHSHSGHGHDGGYGHFGGHAHGLGVSIGHHRVHVARHFVVPHYGHHYHGSYWVDSGRYYYQPRTYVVSPQAHVAAKPIVVEFGGYSQVDDLSGRLEKLANELCLDMHYNYSHNSGFAETYREAYQIFGATKSIHATDVKNDRAEIARRVQELDPLFHHVQSEIKKWNRQHRRQIGQAGILTKTDALEALLHHLMNDVGIKPHSPESIEVAPAPATDEVAPPPAPVAITSPPPPTIP